jgi:hypothetical protein
MKGMSITQHKINRNNKASIIKEDANVKVC